MHSSLTSDSLTARSATSWHERQAALLPQHQVGQTPRVIEDSTRGYRSQLMNQSLEDAFQVAVSRVHRQLGPPGGTTPSVSVGDSSLGGAAEDDNLPDEMAGGGEAAAAQVSQATGAGCPAMHSSTAMSSKRSRRRHNSRASKQHEDGI
ncbi:unnamed protein product [Phytophthora fragariaefolia]|uniref:Unnamed protein product n=1 Tax=Phytophthora fragariaefolia TaxID=1490495 RepID=A0A9W6XYJ3_9STRA|nr:unnamed protein product [Phytophthora fragariaefolia]